MPKNISKKNEEQLKKYLAEKQRSKVATPVLAEPLPANHTQEKQPENK